MTEQAVDPVRAAGERTRTGEQPLPPRRPVRLEGNTVAPPPRPRLTSDLPLPALRPADPLPRTLRVASLLWWAAALAAVLTVVGAALDGKALEQRLTDLAVAADNGAPADVIADGVRMTQLVVLGGTVLLAVLYLVWMGLVRRRRSWARWALLATALPALLVADLTQSTVSGGAELDRVAAVTQAGLIVLGLIAVWLRPSRRWLAGAAGQ